jgi:hypothetical protein
MLQDSNGLKIQFTKPFRLRGEWEVAVVNWFCDDNDENFVWIFCDLVEYTPVNNIPMQLLAIENDAKKKYFKPIYMKVFKKMFSSINVQFKHDHAKDNFEKIKNATCILHFRKA